MGNMLVLCYPTRGGSSPCFSLVMYSFCSNNTHYSASLSFMTFIFLLTPFDAKYCFESNLYGVAYKRVSYKLFLMSLFSCLPCISLGRYRQKCQKWGLGHIVGLSIEEGGGSGFKPYGNYG